MEVENKEKKSKKKTFKSMTTDKKIKFFENQIKTANIEIKKLKKQKAAEEKQAQEKSALELGKKILAVEGAEKLNAEQIEKALAAALEIHSSESD